MKHLKLYNENFNQEDYWIELNSQEHNDIITIEEYDPEEDEYIPKSIDFVQMSKEDIKNKIESVMKELSEAKEKLDKEENEE